MKRWHAWLELARISNLPTVWTNVLAGWLLAGGAWRWMPLGWLLAGGSLLYTAGMILNDAMDVRFDREHRRERPIPSGRVPVSMAWSVGIAMLMAGAAMCFFGAGACGWLVLALVLAIMAYDAFHKPWAGSVLIMGSCRTLLYLVAGSAVAGGLSWETNHELVVKAVALGGYIVGVSLVARHEASSTLLNRCRLGVGLLGLSLPLVGMMLPEAGSWRGWLFALAMAGLMVAGMAFGDRTKKEVRPFGWGSVFVWLIPLIALMDVIAVATSSHEQMLKFIRWSIVLGFAVGMVAVIDKSIKIMRTPPPSNIGRAVGLLLAGIVVVDGLAISFLHPITALVFAASMPLLLLWQRKIAAT